MSSPSPRSPSRAGTPAFTNAAASSAAATAAALAPGEPASDAEVRALLVQLLSDGYPATFSELLHLAGRPRGPTETAGDTAPFLSALKAHLCAAEGARRRGDTRAVLTAYLGAAGLYRGAGQTRLALFFLERVLGLARAAGQAGHGAAGQEMEMAALREMCLVREERGETAEAVAAAEAHKHAAARANDLAEASRAAQCLARTYAAQARAAEALAAASGGAAVAAPAPSPSSSSSSSAAPPSPTSARTPGLLEEALRLRLLELGAARECADAEKEASAAFAVGWAYTRAGQALQGVSFFKQYLRLAHALEADAPGGTGEAHVARALASLAAAHASLGSFDAAGSCLHDLLGVAQASGNVPAHAHALEALGTLAARLGRPAEAEERLAAAYAIRKAAMDSRSPGASRPELDKTRILLGLVRGSAGGTRAHALFASVVSVDVPALLAWRLSRVELPSSSSSSSSSGKAAGGAGTAEPEAALQAA